MICKTRNKTIATMMPVALIHSSFLSWSCSCSSWSIGWDVAHVSCLFTLFVYILKKKLQLFVYYYTLYVICMKKWRLFVYILWDNESCLLTFFKKMSFVCLHCWKKYSYLFTFLKIFQLFVYNLCKLDMSHMPLWSFDLTLVW